MPWLFGTHTWDVRMQKERTWDILRINKYMGHSMMEKSVWDVSVHKQARRITVVSISTNSFKGGTRDEISIWLIPMNALL